MSENNPSSDKIKRLYRALKMSEKHAQDLQQSITEPIAIIGLSCRFPGRANTPEAFWNNLVGSRDGIIEAPVGRWDPEQWLDHDFSGDRNALKPGKTYTNAGGYIDQSPGDFDAFFFGISALEAEAMDPQQRLLLELSYEALEDSGLKPLSIQGTDTGVFIGMSNDDYAQSHRHSGDLSSINAYALTGTTLSTAAGRISYIYGFEGPSMAVDTACSSSLVALGLACASLRHKESSLALVGGVNLILTPEKHVCFSGLQAISPNGRSKAFDASADGYGRGEGCGFVVLKRLSNALNDGDRIRAVVRSVALNQDGKSNGMTAPNGKAQVKVMIKALSDAGLQPDDIDYIEAHGTGTPLGDPIEMEAIGAAYGKDRSSPVIVGSAKTNLGHLEAAAGMAALIKTVLSLEHQTIVPNLHFQTPSPSIPWDVLPVTVPTTATQWSVNGAPRRAGISSFGFSGTNAHVIIEEAPKQETSRKMPAEMQNRLSHLLCFSGATEQASRALAGRLAPLFKHHAAAEICHASNTTRQRLAAPTALMADTPDAFQAALLLYANGKRPTGLITPRLPPDTDKRVAFIFSGQSRHYPYRGKALLDSSSVFKAAIQECDEIVHASLDLSLITLISKEDERLEQVEYTQPVLFALEYALAKLWISWGISPSAVLGHSFGEYVAACIAGVFSLEDSLKLVIARGEVIKQLSDPGCMLAIAADDKVIDKVLSNYSDTVSTASINAPGNRVIAGAPADVAEVLETVLAECGEDAVRHHYLNIPYASHSPVMEQVIDSFIRKITGITPRKPKIPVISNTTGDYVDPATYGTPSYWANHLRNTVQFSKALTTLLDDDYHIFIEIGPHPTLTGMGKINAGTTPAIFLPSLYQEEDDWKRMLTSLGHLWVNGCEIDWRALDGDIALHKVPLPTYPFQRKTYWKEPVISHQGVKVPDRTAAPTTEVTVSATIKSSEGLKNSLYAILTKVSAIQPEDINSTSNFFAMGFDSLMLTRLKQGVKETFYLDIPVSNFYEEVNTPEALLEAIATRVPEKPVVVSSSPTISTEAPHFPQGAVGDLFREQIEIMHRQLDILKSGSTVGPVKKQSDFPPINYRAQRFSPDQLTLEQQKFLKGFIQRFSERTKASAEQVNAYDGGLCDWLSSINFRQTLRKIQYPLVHRESQDSRFTDIDGNDYVDIGGGYGATFFGNRPAFIVEAIQKQLEKGYELGPRYEDSREITRLLRELTGMERVIYTNSGTEAVMTAIRIARAATGRDTIVTFVGAYHGSFDCTLAAQDGGDTRPIAAGTPYNLVRDTVLLDYGEESALDYIRQHGSDIAAVILEPVISRKPQLQPKAFLQELRRITKETSTALVFDEIVTGFRVHPGGAQAYFDIRADIATYGKVVGGGMPIGIVTGTASFMDTIDGGAWTPEGEAKPDANTCFFAGTFCQHPLTMAATHAALCYIKEQGPALQQGVADKVTELATRLNAYFRTEKVPIEINHFSSFFKFDFLGTYDAVRLPIEIELFNLLMIHKGIYLWERRICFFTIKHTDEDIDQIVQAVQETIAELRVGGFGFSLDDDKELERIYPMSSVQRRMYVLSTMENVELAYHVTGAVTAQGPLDPVRMKKAFAVITSRHDSLRTGFEETEIDGYDGLIQRVHHHIEPVIVEVEISENEIDQFVDGFMQPFDLAHPPLYRIGLAKTGSDRWFMIMDFHHIMADGLSMNVLVQELLTLYSGGTLSPVRTQYHSFAEYERNFATSDDFARQEQWWLKKFAGELPSMELPLDYPRPPEQTFVGKVMRIVIDQENTAQIQSFARVSGVSTFMVLLTAFKSMLHRLTGKTDITVGIPAGARPGSAFDNCFGMFANTLVLRATVTAETRFEDLMHEIRRDNLGSYEHANYPFELLVKKLNIPREMNRNPLFDIQVIYEKGDGRAFHMDDVSFAIYDLDKKTSQFDLTFEVIEEGGVLKLNVEYNTDLLRTETVANWMGYFHQILKAGLAAASVKISDIDLISEEEKEYLVQKLNQTKSNYPRLSTIAQVFEEAADRVGEKTAITFEQRNLSYAELNRVANKLAHYLITECGVQPDDRIVIHADRNEMLPAIMLGILKAGAGYVPVDPTYPDHRKQHMVEDSGATIAIISDDYHDETVLANITCISFSRLPDTLADTNPSTDLQPDHLAYQIYTSGSTGKPKGVMVTNRNVISFGHNLKQVWGITADDSIYALTTICFDISVLEILNALCLGCRVVMAGDAEISEPSMVYDEIEHQNVTVLQVTPSRMKLLADAGDIARFKRLRCILIGGEAVSRDLAETLLPLYGHTRIYNVYGPTETTVWSTTREMTGPNVLSIGTPLLNETVYILDEQNRLVPRGCIGELCIGGDGVTRGYHNHDKLTADRFRSNPYHHGLLYRTGDMARILPDGNIEFLGRNDFQVKIRGYRIELGEIEYQIKTHPAVTEAVLIGHKTLTGMTELVAYLVANVATVNIEGLREHLAQTLPDYMIPARFVMLDRIPMTENGKVNRTSLPDPYETGVSIAETYIAPTNETEKTIVRIWQEVLGINKIGIRDNYFVRGGDSIKAIQVVNRLTRAGLKTDMRTLFAHPTIERLATVLASPATPQQPVAAETEGMTENISSDELDSLFDEGAFVALAKSRRTRI